MKLLSIFSTNPILVAERELKQSRLYSLEAAKKALHHKAESEAQKIYAQMYLEHSKALIKQLEEWNSQS